MSTIWTVVFSLDGTRAISGSSDATLKLWDVETGQELRTFVGHTNRITSVALSDDGKIALSGSDDMTLKLWNTDSGEMLEDRKDTPQTHAKLLAEYGISLGMVIDNQSLMLQHDGNAVQIRQSGDEAPIFTFTTDANIFCTDIASNLVIVAGDKGGYVHILRPNAALRRLLKGEEPRGVKKPRSWEKPDQIKSRTNW
jgi:WD40 repeat protein